MRQLFAVLALGLAADAAAAQSTLPADLGPTASLGQPTATRWSAAGATGWAEDLYATAAFGAQRDLLNPLLGIAALHAEAYLQGGSAGLTPGLRARLVSPFLRVGAGADIQSGHGTEVLLSVFHPLRRGGLFRDGSVVRLDYLPRRSHSLSVGVEKPVLLQTRIGRSRPARDHVRLPRGRNVATESLPAELAAPMAEARARSHRIRLMVLPLGPVPARRAIDPDVVAAEMAPLLEAMHPLDPAEDSVGDRLRAGEVAAPEAEVRRYHEALERAFAIVALDDSAPDRALGARLADAARSVLLSDVLLPYNRLLGQLKHPDGLAGLAAAARTSFDQRLDDVGVTGGTRRDAALRVFDELLAIVEENRAAAREQWRDNRFVWLPLQLALLPEQHDTQAELDALIEEAIGVRFTEGNFVSYLVNEQFQYHLSRTIRETRDYHVLWTHDFRGVDGHGAIDEMSFRHVVSSYLQTLTERVQEYDRTGRIPTYMIIIDQWFYEVNRGRRWLTLLEDPLGHQLKLPPEHAAWQDSVAAAQDALRRAIAASVSLQHGARQHGDGWLRNLVKVHVNVTNPADASFSSARVVRGVPLPDNMMRDHRKIVFYDITEADPYRGEAIFTGAGVGEHYANLSWEDRSLLVRGPALLPLKSITADLLVNQGIPRGKLPHVLRPAPLPDDYADRIRIASLRNQQPLRALQAHNGAGFADKQVNVAKAILYTLMPAGSVISIPDSLWNSDFWGSALLGCALRGGRILIVAPAAANAPADAFGTLGRSHEMLARLLAAQQLLLQPIDRAGGLFRVGLFRSSHPVNDIPAKVRLTHEAFADQPWLRELFALAPSVLDELAGIAAEIEHLSMAPEAFAEFEYDPTPKLHLKANFFASAEAWTLMTRPEWAAAAWAYMQIRVNQLQTRSAAVGTFDSFPEAIADVGGGMVRDWQAGLDAATADRVIFYTLMGSHNQNSRSMVIDAEAGFLMSGWPAIIPQIDLIVIMGQTVWLDDPADLASMLPLDTGLKRRLAHWFRLAL